MASSVPQPSDSTKSKKKPLITSSKQAPPPPPSDTIPSWSTPTPEKPPQPSRRLRNRGVVMSVKEVRNVAKSLRESDPDRSGIRRPGIDPVSSTSKLSSARKQIVSWPGESPVRKPKNVDGGPIKLPEKYEMFSEFFNCLDSSIRLLRMKGSMTTFANICPKVESLTDRRFSYGHLAQLKFILPEAIVVKKVMLQDDRTSCMKPDLHVILEADAIKNDGKLKSGSGNLHMRKVFRARLVEFFKSHPEGDDIPEETLPEPFSRSKPELHADTIEGSNSSLLTETSVNSELEQLPAVASHLSQNFHRHFSRKASSHVAENTLQKHIKDPPMPSVLPLTDIIQGTPTKLTSTQAKLMTLQTHIKDPPLPSLLPLTDIIKGTPTKLTSTPAKLMTSTPALQTPKRCLMSPYDDSNKSPNKLLRRALTTRSLKFDTPVKNTKVEDVNEAGCSSIDSDIFDILPESLLLSIKEKERKAMEERDPAISQAKRRRDMIASLPKLFNIIHFFFQSIKRSVVTKDELIHKIIASHFDIVDRRELEEQLLLLQEIVPEWISEKLASSGDYLLRINKTSNTELIRTRLAEAT